MHLDFPESPQGVRVGRTLLFGPSGSGKTTFGGVLIRTQLRWPRKNIRCVAPPTKPKLARLLGVPHLGLDIQDRDRQEQYFTALFDAGTKPYDDGGLDIGLALDDADFYFSQQGRAYGVQGLQKIVKLGREAGISQVFIAQGSSQVAKDLISNSNAVFIARTTEPNLLDYARRYMRDVPHVEELIGNLPPHVFLAYMPTQSPKFQGFCKVVNGAIQCREPSEAQDSPTSDESEEAPGPEEPASSPDAAESSATDTGPTSVESTSEPGEGSNPASESAVSTTAK